jgi:hypothetical protein
VSVKMQSKRAFIARTVSILIALCFFTGVAGVVSTITGNVYIAMALSLLTPMAVLAVGFAAVYFGLIVYPLCLAVGMALVWTLARHTLAEWQQPLWLGYCYAATICLLLVSFRLHLHSEAEQSNEAHRAQELANRGHRRNIGQYLPLDRESIRITRNLPEKREVFTAWPEFEEDASSVAVVQFAGMRPDKPHS